MKLTSKAAAARVLAIGAALAIPFLATAVTAATTPRVTGFDVEQVLQLDPGTDLSFTVWGTPGAQAALQIDGAQRALALVETSPGIYRGIYTISQRDRIQPDARVSANLRSGNRVGSAILDEDLRGGTPRAADTAGAEPKIDRFEVRHGAPGAQGRQLDFTLIGTPGGRANVRMVGAQPRFRLTETRAGTYTGSYTVQPNDRLDPKDAIVARLRVGDRSTSTTLENALDVNRLNRLALAQPCSDCATVTAVNRVEVEGDGRYIGGAVAGGLLGAVLGSQVGGGSGRTAAQVAGVLGGAVLGREVQKRTEDKEDHFEVVLRMRDDGSQRMVSYEDAPAFKVGDKVLLRDGGLTLDR